MAENIAGCISIRASISECLRLVSGGSISLAKGRAFLTRSDGSSSLLAEGTFQMKIEIGNDNHFTNYSSMSFIYISSQQLSIPGSEV